MMLSVQKQISKRLWTKIYNDNPINPINKKSKNLKTVVQCFPIALEYVLFGTSSINIVARS